MKSSARPIGPLVIGFYFFPMLVFILFSSSQKSKTGFLAATVAICLAATALFLILKSWQFEAMNPKKKQKETPPQMAPRPAPSLAPKVDEEAMQKKIDELKKEFLAAQEKKAAEFRAREEKLEDELKTREKALKEELLQKQEALHQSEASLLEKTLHAKIQNETIERLTNDIKNLQFELKTLLKVSQR